MLALPAFTHAPEVNRVYQCDALTLLKALEPQSVDAIITDLPYGTTACKWDTIIPFEPMWAAVKRVLKPRGVFVTTATEPFASLLRISNLEWFKYDWVWEKTLAANFFNAKNKPLALHENVLVFSDGTTANGSGNRMPYYPQELIKADIHWSRPSKYPSEHKFVRESHKLDRVIEYTNYPSSVLHYPNGNNNNDHPTQKPVALYEYLISTYTQPGELVVDPCCGSGTTGVAARNLKRDYILNDSAPEYVEIARDRLRQPWDKRRTKESDLSGLPLFAEAVI